MTKKTKTRLDEEANNWEKQGEKETARHNKTAKEIQ